MLGSSLLASVSIVEPETQALVRRAQRLASQALSASGEASVVGEQRDLDAVVELELGQQPRDVRLDGRDAHVEVGGDLGVRLALGDGNGDLALAVGETLEEAT